MNITVYLGANQGNDPALGRAVEELGRWIGESGHRLIYGGSKSGLMGVLADCVLNAGGGRWPFFMLNMALFLLFFSPSQVRRTRR